MIPSLLVKVYRSWRGRHRRGVNFALHVVGIPLCFVVAPILLLVRLFLAAGVCFVVGYVLQFVGHALEGNRSGEEMLLRRLLGRK